MTNYLIAAFTLIGTIANAYGKPWSFKVWLATNTYWAIYNGVNGDIPQCLIFLTNAVVCLIGIKKWRENINEN